MIDPRKSLVRSESGPARAARTVPESLVSKGVGQVGILVPDLDAALRTYGVISTVETWSVWTYGPETVPILRLHGRPAAFSMRIALGGTGPQVELIEPLHGPSIYDDWLGRHGYGLHHLGFYVDSIGDAMDVMTTHGFEILQSGVGYGLDGDGGFAYFDTTAETGVILEAIEIPARRRRPDMVWRPPTAPPPPA